jgi:hypothetical protein
MFRILERVLGEIDRAYQKVDLEALEISIGKGKKIGPPQFPH